LPEVLREGGAQIFPPQAERTRSSASEHGRLGERIEAGQRHFVLVELEGLSGDR
jgi:hypothetical protein